MGNEQDDTDMSEISNGGNEFDNRLNQTHVLRCDLCDKTFFDENELNRHIRHRHSQSVKPRKQKQDDSISLKEDVYVETVKIKGEPKKRLLFSFGMYLNIV